MFQLHSKENCLGLSGYKKGPAVLMLGQFSWVEPISGPLILFGQYQ